MTYREFVDKIVEKVKNMTGIDNVFFREADDRLAEDSIMVVLCGDDKDKFVGRILPGEAYREYQSGRSMGQILKEIMDGICPYGKMNVKEKMEALNDYEKVKGDLFLKPLNYERNKKKLEGAVYQKNGDIALAVCHRLAEAKGCMVSGYILSETVKKWGKEEEMVFEEARKNTGKIRPARVIYLDRLLFDPDYEGEDLMDPSLKIGEDQKIIGTCVSVAGKTNGAVAVFEPEAARRLSDLMEGDFYIAFTSLHEAMLHSTQMVEAKDLEEVLKATVESNTPEEDILTLHIYRYSREKDRIEMVPSVEEE